MEIALWCAGMSRQDRQRLRCRRAVLRARWHRFFDRYRALLLPVFGTTALPPRDQRVPLLADEATVGGLVVPVFALSSWCAVAGVAGLPAVSMPVGRTGDGLPVGMQVLGRSGSDEALLDLVERLAEVLR
jgi:amidase